jgi:uncharacterized DUF497 family protein
VKKKPPCHCEKWGAVFLWVRGRIWAGLKMESVMKFEWDEAKRATNLDKHGLDFELAHFVFAGDTFTFEDNRMAYGEQRFVTLGLLDDTVVVLVHTENDDEIRVISLRKAVKNEQKLYFTNI